MDALDYIQIFATVAFLAIVLARTVSMRVRNGVNPLALGTGAKGLRRILEILVPVFMFVWVGAVVLTAADGSSALPGPLDEVIIDSSAAGIAGAILLVVSIALFVAALAAFGVSWRIGIDERTPGALVTRGVFHYSRNPIFVSMGVFFLGVFLIQGTLFFLAAVAIEWAWTHYQVLEEEKFLAGEYGDAYLDYRAATPRYIGLPRETVRPAASSDSAALRRARQ